MIRITKWTTVLLKLLPVAIGIATINEIFNISFLQQVVASGIDPYSDASPISWVFLLAFGIFTLIGAGIGIWVLVAEMGFMLRAGQWIKTVAPNEFSYRPGWGIWGWLVPFVNYFMPFRILKEISIAGRRPEVEQPLVRGLLIRYWVFQVTSTLLGNIQFRLSLSEDDSYESVVGDSVLSVIIGAADIVAFITLIPLLKAMSSGLQRREAEISVIASN